ncbi:alpha/beta hydrolase family protein [Kribbella voronezhensis]|uniref:Alpha/beta hydrolase family protein n=1 Tax=Kribbella voronezhensis TaxID=2512212 RepID=A0A4R7TFZ0_9ACTN|nr:alpha/beta fold hydrolase [Kribbella voronezhensis]TDU91114.1 alpha/beta hydrolase family protein [Kribbella voronezhensis]
MTTNTAVQTSTIHHDGVTISMSRGGHGRPMILCPGLNSTQADLHELVGLLRHDYDVVTFDLRGHGLSSAADSYLFADFLSDLTAVTSTQQRIQPEATPVLVGYSLGADLAVHYASEHPGSVTELLLIDGANPVPEPFITATDLPLFRALWEQQAEHQETLRGTPRQVLLTAQEILDLNVQLDGIRARILDRYRTIDRPITMIMSAAMAGDSSQGRALNQNWQAGFDRLVQDQPQINTFRIDADHGLVLTHAPQIADIIRTTG